MSYWLLASHGLQAAGTLVDSYFSYQRASLVARQSELNARYIEATEDDIRRKGDMQAKKLKEEGRKFLGSQKASVLAQGVELDSDVAIRLKEQAEDLIAEDVEELRQGVWAQAFGLETQAEQTRLGGQVSAQQLRGRALGAAAGGLIKFGGAYEKYRYLQDTYGLKKGADSPVGVTTNPRKSLIGGRGSYYA